jgi:hypothetical protein
MPLNPKVIKPWNTLKINVEVNINAPPHQFAIFPTRPFKKRRYFSKLFQLDYEGGDQGWAPKIC